MVTVGKHLDFNFHLKNNCRGVTALCLLLLDYLIVVFPL